MKRKEFYAETGPACPANQIKLQAGVSLPVKLPWRRVSNATVRDATTDFIAGPRVYQFSKSEVSSL
jgi:hypothetical protein